MFVFGLVNYYISVVYKCLSPHFQTVHLMISVTHEYTDGMSIDIYGAFGAQYAQMEHLECRVKRWSLRSI